MREVVFEGKKDFEGKVVVTLPLFAQKLKYIKECNFKTNKKGEVEVGLEQLDSLIKMIEIAEKHIKSVEMKCGDIVAKSWEDLNSNPEFEPIIPEIATLVINGGQMGNG